MVKYCSRDCQVAHRPQHKKACKKRAAELYDEELFKEHPEREECPICMLPLPLHPSQITFKTCCGQNLCAGCVYAQRTEGLMSGKAWEDTGDCAFCRMPVPKTKEETIDRIKKCMEKKNAAAFFALSSFYKYGDMGLPRDPKKAKEVLLKGVDLDSADIYCNLGIAYEDERDMDKATYYYGLAAIRGDTDARYSLGRIEMEASSFERAYKHFIIGAKAGEERSIQMLQSGFKDGYVTKDEYADALRAYQQRSDETNSAARDLAFHIITKRH